ncbi:hypothetical protein GGI15_002889 [Coemansia interrupta]|uniref:Uncharacterized protein n=1 Tax=Coemansia interrupta TaxID=1126814 RepID=A0A9W8LKC0_9FUNG|nr:hypothetical protein GGI15_002889 [Coemansia interrupta]
MKEFPIAIYHYSSSDPDSIYFEADPMPPPVVSSKTTMSITMLKQRIIDYYNHIDIDEDFVLGFTDRYKLVIIIDDGELPFIQLPDPEKSFWNFVQSMLLFIQRFRDEHSEPFKISFAVIPKKDDEE